MSVHICGYENIVAKSNDTIAYNLDITEQLEPIVLNVSDLFTNTDSSCVHQPWRLNFTLVQKNNSYIMAEKLNKKQQNNFVLSEDMLTITVVELGIFDIYVMASADPWRYGYKHFWFNLTTPPLPYRNLPPQFDEDVTSTHSVIVVRDENDTLQGDPVMEYTTPTVSDLEENEIIFKFEGFDELPYASYVINKD